MINLNWTLSLARPTRHMSINWHKMASRASSTTRLSSRARRAPRRTHSAIRPTIRVCSSRWTRSLAGNPSLWMLPSKSSARARLRSIETTCARWHSSRRIQWATRSRVKFRPSTFRSSTRKAIAHRLFGLSSTSRPTRSWTSSAVRMPKTLTTRIDSTDVAWPNSRYLSARTKTVSYEDVCKFGVNEWMRECVCVCVSIPNIWVWMSNDDDHFHLLIFLLNFSLVTFFLQAYTFFLFSSK